MRERFLTNIILMVLTMYHWDIVGIQTRSRSDINEQIIFRLGNIIIISGLYLTKYSWR